MMIKCGMLMTKELEFECGRCWEPETDKHFKFRRNDWTSHVRIDICGESYINVESLCPICGTYCYRDFGLDQLLEMIFELQDDIKYLRQKFMSEDE